MAKNWYPVIDILTCAECGTCVDFCPHGVYDRSKTPSPVVVNPDSCVDHCTQCAKRCPQGAISYVGDTGDSNATPRCCCCGLTDLEKNTNAKGKAPLSLKILVPALIVCAVLAIIVVKGGMFSADKPQENVPLANELQASDDSQDKADEQQTGEPSGEAFPLKITSVNLEEIKAYGVPTVIDFGSDSCIPCKAMAPVLETLNAEFGSRAAVQFMDVWQYTDGVQDFPVQVIPTQVFFTAEGKPFEPSEELAAKIQLDQYTYRDSGELAFTVHQGGISEEDMRFIFAEMGVE